MAQQLALNLALRDDARFDNFYIAGDQNILVHLQKAILNQSDLFIYLWGSSGTGLSHLLQAACHFASDAQRTAVYLSLADYQQLSPDILEGLESRQLVCLDDIDCIAQHPVWEEALFHCFNRLREKNIPLITAAKSSPALLPLQLADLKSRLQWGLTLHLPALNDADKLAALQQRAQLRGIELTDDVGLFLLRHQSRTMHDLFDSFAKLDRASLVEQRKLTVPFVKRVLNI